MISPAFEAFILAQEETFLTPANQLALLIDTHNMDHAKLLLSHISYSRVPVVTETNQFVGTIGLTEIMQYQIQTDSPDEALNLDISPIVHREVPTVTVDYRLEELLHKLVDASFLPVIGQNKEFLGIITRKSILKAFNAFLHNFDQEKE